MNHLERVHVRPARPGLRVLDPDHGSLPLPAEGLEVTLSSYWIRRIQDGDVIRDEEPKTQAAAEKPKPRKEAHP